MRIPYVTGGRSAAGADCWGLVRIVRQALRGDVLPMYETVSAVDRADVPVVSADFLAHGFPADPAPGVIAFVFEDGECTHCGIVLDVDGRRIVLDTSSKHGPMQRRLRDFERVFRDVAYYDY